MFKSHVTLPAIALALCTAGSTVAGDIAPDDIEYKDGRWIEKPLTQAAGDPVAGRKVFVNRKLGNCLACHVNSDIPEQPFHGEIGPSLDGVGGRYDIAMLRGMVVNMKNALNPESLMPGFYSLDTGSRIHKKFAGKTILSAQQVEDVLAYLQTLK
jgi:sulfur-oxidizing protein SoxX